MTKKMMNTGKLGAPVLVGLLFWFMSLALLRDVMLQTYEAEE